MVSSSQELVELGLGEQSVLEDEVEHGATSASARWATREQAS